MASTSAPNGAAVSHGVKLDGLSAPQLTQLIADAEEARRALAENGKQKLIEEMRARAAELGLDPATLFGRAPSSAAAAPRARRKPRDARMDVAPKFRGPNGETWSGRGRMPKWLHEAEANGKKRAEFAV